MEALDMVAAVAEPQAQWAQRISAAWQKSLDAVFETGRLIAGAKAALPHGAFTAMIETDLPFGARYAQMLMKVAEDPRLTDPKHASVLPASPATLYELTKLDPETFERRVAEGTIRPDMQRREVATGGARSIMASREQPAESLDFFPTPPWATRALIEVVLPRLGIVPGNMGRVWEPACGEGHMSGVLAEYVAAPNLVATDIRHYGREGRDAPGWRRSFDFLASDPLALMGLNPDWIITNPPFGETTLSFALRALDLARKGVALFVRQQWLEGVERYGALFRDRPPTLYAQFAERVNLCEGRWDPFGSTATAYCWLVWVRDRAPEPLFWIPPGQRKALHRDDDIERFTARPVLAPIQSPADVPAFAGWSEAAIAVLRSGYEQGLRPAEIARQLGTSTGAVFGKANRLGLTDRARQGARTDLANREPTHE